MEKMFTRSVLGAAMALAAVSGSANAAIDLNGEAVQLYGQAAGFMHFVNPSDTTKGDGNGGVTTSSSPDSAVQGVIESRVGFRGRVAFDDFGPDFIWQIESGDANHTDYGSFGMRDTFVGLDFDGIGSFKFGRQLVAAYNYVDWPHSNPGLANVFDWNNDIGAAFEDRADNNLRYDSPTWGGFNFQATLSGMGSNSEAMVANIAGSYTMDMFSVHAGYYDQKAYDVHVAATSDSYVFNPATGVADFVAGKAASTNQLGNVSYGIIGGSVFLGDFTLTAAWKTMENAGKDGAEKQTQEAYSATAQYILDSSYVFKIGYAGTTDSKGKVGYTQDDSDTAITGRFGYLLPSAYMYVDVRHYDMASYAAKEFTETKATNVLVGVEYYF